MCQCDKLSRAVIHKDILSAMESDAAAAGMQANGGSSVECDTSAAATVASASGGIDLRSILNPCECVCTAPPNSKQFCNPTVPYLGPPSCPYPAPYPDTHVDDSNVSSVGLQLLFVSPRNDPLFFRYIPPSIVCPRPSPHIHGGGDWVDIYNHGHAGLK